MHGCVWSACTIYGRYSTFRSQVYGRLDVECVKDLVPSHAGGDVPVEGWVVAVCVIGAVLVVGAIVALVFRGTQRSKSSVPLMGGKGGKATTYHN